MLVGVSGGWGGVGVESSPVGNNMRRDVYQCGCSEQGRVSLSDGIYQKSVSMVTYDSTDTLHCAVKRDMCGLIWKQ